MGWGLALKLGKKVLGSKYTYYVLLALTIAFSLYRAYDFILERGIQQGVTQEHDKLQPQIDKATRARQQAEQQLAAYKASYANWKAQSEDAKAKAHKEQAAVVKALQTQLETAKKKYAAAIANPKEVIRYVSPKASAACTIPAGFVQLFNSSAEGTGVAPDLSAGGTGDVDAPSGVDLSAVAQATAENNAKALYWRSQVIAWQQWYQQSYAIWQTAEKQAENNAPKQ